jgi:hypothetical protein
MADQILKFPRKRNADGTFDLTCPFCFLTIAFGVRVSEVEALERGHAVGTKTVASLSGPR